jgi:Tol biopolymer transport system component
VLDQRGRLRAACGRPPAPFDGCTVSDPSWSPDGTRIAFAVVCNSGEYAVWSTNTAGTNASLVTTFPDLASQPSWQPLVG